VPLRQAPDADKCVKATAALRKCFARRPDHFGAYYTERIDKGLDQDTNPTPQEIESYRRRGKFRWWTGMQGRIQGGTSGGVAPPNDMLFAR
jgi:hypothetical protein